MTLLPHDRKLSSFGYEPMAGNLETSCFLQVLQLFPISVDFVIFTGNTGIFRNITFYRSVCLAGMATASSAEKL